MAYVTKREQSCIPDSHNEVRARIRARERRASDKPFRRAPSVRPESAVRPVHTAPVVARIFARDCVGLCLSVARLSVVRLSIAWLSPCLSQGIPSGVHVRGG